MRCSLDASTGVADDFVLASGSSLASTLARRHGALTCFAICGDMARVAAPHAVIRFIVRVGEDAIGGGTAMLVASGCVDCTSAKNGVNSTFQEART